MKVLVPVKINEHTDTLIEYLDKLTAKIPGVELFFLHVLKPEDVRYDYDLNATAKENYKETFLGYKKLEDIVQVFIEKDIQTKDLVKKGQAHIVILKEAQRLECDLIILGSYERNTFMEALTGSVKLKVLQDSPIPVLIYPQNKD